MSRAAWDKGEPPPPRRRLLDPTWRKAPLNLLLRFPSQFLAVTVAAAVIAVASASTPLFLSSVGSAAVGRELSALTPDAAGMVIRAYGPPDRERVARADRQVDGALGELDGLGPPSLTMLGSQIDVGDDGLQARHRGRLLARDGAFDQVTLVAGGEGDGVWIAEGVADVVGVGVGDAIGLAYGDQRTEALVVGVYDNLARSPITAYWRPLSSLIVIHGPNGPEEQPPFVLADRATYLRLGAQLQDQTRYRWDAPLVTDEFSLAGAAALRRQMEATDARVRNRLTPTGEALYDLHLYRSGIESQTLFPAAVRSAEGAVAALEPAVRLLGLSARVVALLILAAAAVFGSTRRERESRLLVAKGVGPATLGLRAAAEILLPVAVGVAVGHLVARWLVRTIGPSSLLGPSAGASALRAAAVTGLVGVGLVAAVTAVHSRWDHRREHTMLGRAVGRVPWDVILLALAAASYYQLVIRGTARADGAGVDLLVLVFPLLLLGGVTGLGIRGLRRILPRLPGMGGSASMVRYLAVRRLTAASTPALALIGAVAISIGVLVYAGGLVRSNEVTLDAKAAVLAGSDLSVAAPPGSAPPQLAGHATHVNRTRGRLVPGEARVEVLAVDTETFSDAALWHDHFADRPLPELLEALTTRGERLPVLLAGIAPREVTSLETTRWALPVRVVAHTRAFPGMAAGRPLVVVSEERLVEAAAATGASVDERLLLNGELWVRGDPAATRAVLEAAGLPTGDAVNAADVSQRPGIAAVRWTFAYLQSLGVAAGMLVLVALLLYLQARQQTREVSYALSRRMGLSRHAHRRAIAVELAGMLGVAFALGGSVSLAAVALVNPRLDPLAELPPGPVFTLPASLLLAVIAGLGLTAVAGAWFAQRAADRARVAEVLRLGP